MLRNYLKIACRNLLKHKVFSLVNILGLAIGMTAFLLILQYVNFELSYDNFQKKGADIYRIHAFHEQHHEIVRKTSLIPSPLGPDLQKNFAEVVNATRLILPWSGQAASSTLVWQDQGKTIKQNFKWGFYTDPAFLDMFSFTWIKGNQQKALDKSHQVVISESTARKLFGNHWKENDHIIGQSLEYINEFDRFTLVITGIIADAPANSHLQYDFLASISTLSTGWAKDFMDTWESNGVYTYLQLAPKTDVNAFADKMNVFVSQHAPEELVAHTRFDLLPLKKIHLYSHLEEELKANGNAVYVYLLSLLAVLILCIALVNYINLTTAKAVYRGNEVGLRKVMGAIKSQIIKQFLFESLFINSLALILAITTLQPVSPYYTELTGKDWNLSIDQYGWIVFSLFIVSTLLSGIYPAFILSGYHPMQVLKGKFVHSQNGRQMRKGMVVFQFWASIILMIFTFTIYRQLHYMQTFDPGFEQESVLVVKGPGNRTKTWIEHAQQRKSSEEDDFFKATAMQLSGVQAISLSWSIPGEKNSIWPLELGEKYDHQKLEVITADSDYAHVFGLKLLAGEFNTDQGYVINESAAEILGYPNPKEAVGEVFKGSRNQEHRILGVVKDYHHHSLRQAIHPLIFVKNDPSYTLDSYYSIKLNTNQLNVLTEQLGELYAKAYPHDLFEYYFIDQYFDAQYREEQRFGKLFSLFSGLCIFIACMGLFGLSLQTVTEKHKEIGIRKVLGASVQSILVLLTQKTLKLIFIACMLALPIAYWIIQNWLTQYAYSITLNWWHFAVPVSFIAVLVFITILFHSGKAALTKPVKSLRHE